MAQGMSTKYLTQIHDVFLENKDKSLFVVLDFMEGGSIIDYIGKVYTLDWRSTAKIIYGALNGLL
jgi:serine/threonine protein kinase